MQIGQSTKARWPVTFESSVEVVNKSSAAPSPGYFKTEYFTPVVFLPGVKYSGVQYSVLKYSCTAVPAASTVDADAAAACVHDALDAFLLEPLPSRMNQRHQHVSPNGHGVRLGWRQAMSRAIAP